MKSPTISYLTDVYFAPGAIDDLPSVAEAHQIRRPLLVTDRGVLASGLADRPFFARDRVFDAVESNPTEQSVVEGLRLYGERDCDGVIALGGGSPMDCAKCIALLATHPPPLEQYAFILGGLPRIRANKPPVICIPTTAGTGSEVGRAALITLESGRKLAILSPRFIPTAAICDPYLTLGLPPLLTAATGMDAISHCVESFLSPRFNPVADAIALDGLGRGVMNLRRAVEHPDDLEARSAMMMSALEGGLTFQKGLGAIHALSHPLGALPGKRLHHGTLNAVLLPHVLRFNEPNCREKFSRLSRLLGADDLPRFFERLSREIGLPARLFEMGASEAELADIPEQAMHDHCSATNPRPASPDDYRAILRSAL